MPPSKLSALCDKIIEAGWLAAVVVTPLYFSGYSSTYMDADKLALLRSIASVMVAAWLIKWIAGRRHALSVAEGSPRSQPRTSWRSPMVLPLLLVVGAYLLATLTSIVPRTSLLGSYHRAQGTYTLVSFVVVFAMIGQGLRTRQQLDRLIVTIILTSLPIALYGILQAYGLDPLVWRNDFGGRPGSTAGNPIFLSAYLIMVFTLTVGKIVASGRAALGFDKTVKGGSPAARGVAAGSAAALPPTRVHVEIVLAMTYTLIAAAQAAAIVLTDSRGPFLGWFAGIVLFLFLMALVWRKRWLVLGAVGLGIAGALCLIALNLPNTPLERLRSLPPFARLGNLMDRTGEFRLFTWENAARLALPHAPVQFPDGTPDALNVIRPVVGYGPEAMPLVYTQVAPASPFSREVGTDRSHNATWDAWVTTGVIGLGAYQLFFLCLFLYGLRWLGLLPTDRWRNGFVGLWVGLGITGALATIILGQPRYLGLALPAGNVLAMVLYLGWFALSADHPSPAEPARRADHILLAALLAGLFAHYVESQFGIDVPPAQTLLWVFAAMLAKTGEVSEAPPVSADGLGAGACYAIVIAIILSTLVYEFVKYEKGLADPFLLLWRDLTFDPVRHTTTYAVLGLLLSTWVLAVILTWGETRRAQGFKPSPPWRAGLIVLITLPVVLTALFAFGLAIQLAALPYLQTPVERVENVSALAGQVSGIIDYYPLALCLGILMAGVALLSEALPLAGAWSETKGGLIALVPVALATAVWINVVNLNPVRADATYRLGQLFDDQADWNAAIALYQRAIRLAPANDAYYLTLAHTYQQKASLASPTAPSLFNAGTSLEEILKRDAPAPAGLNRLDSLYAAQAMLRRARDLNPLYADHTINLARFYQPALPVNTPSKAKLADLANQYYTEAQRLNPNNVLLWNERADFDLTYRNDPDAALQKLKESLARDPQFEQTYLNLGKAYAAKQDYRHAIEAYQQALAVQPQSNEAQSRLAFAYYSQGRLAEAIQAYQQYIARAPNASNLWEAHKNLALLYEQTGDLLSAIQEAERATRLAPPDLTAALAELVARLRAKANPPSAVPP